MSATRAGRVAMLAGAAGSLALMLSAGQRQNSRILLLLFAGWVLSPFVAAILANAVWRSWADLTRATLSVTMMVITAGSLAAYGSAAFGYTGAKVGSVFLIVPLLSWLLMAGAVGIAALVARGQTRKGKGALQL